MLKHNKNLTIQYIDMDFRSESSNIDDLLKIDELTSIELTERPWGHTQGQVETQAGGIDWDDDMNQDGGAVMNGSCQLVGEIDAGVTSLDTYEKDFYEIFNKAKEYRQRVDDVQRNNQTNQVNQVNQTQAGGREPNPTIMVLIHIAKIVKASNQYTNVSKWTDFIKIGKLILDKAKEKTGITDLSNKALVEEYTTMAHFPKQFDAEIKVELAKPPKSKAEKKAMHRPHKLYMSKPWSFAGFR